MNKEIWFETIKNNFNHAANNYSDFALVQKYFARKIIFYIENLHIKEGLSVDLGSGTGFLADQIENSFPNRKVIRVDFCENMLFENKKNSIKILWDLNKGFPLTEKKITLIVSNFCLHWLNKPEYILKEWFDNLASGGIMIVSFPHNECFPEWKEACRKSNIEYSGLIFPENKVFNKALSKYKLVTIKSFSYKEIFPNIFYLFKNIKNIGAHSTQKGKMSIGEFKKMQYYWPKDIKKNVTLTWKVNIIILIKE